jgi:ABC-2 type transport system ATP-binding protein
MKGGSSGFQQTWAALAVEAHDLAKTFRSGWLGRRKTPALQGVSLAIPRGVIFGLLGPNGAGKTTLLSILATLLLPDRGRATILGHDLARESSGIRRRINMASGNAHFLWSMRVESILIFYGRLYGLSGRALAARVEEMLALAELRAYRRVPYNELSNGLKQRLALAKSLVNRPELLFLDEPTLGLDPDVATRLRAQIAALRRDRGSTILLTTHYMREAEELCDEIAFLKGGHLLTQGSAEELKRTVRPGKVIALHLSTDVASVLAELPGVLRTNVRDGWIELTVDSAEKRVAEVLGRLNALGVDVKKLEVRGPELEEVFVEFAR